MFGRGSAIGGTGLVDRQHVADLGALLAAEVDRDDVAAPHLARVARGSR
jgi:hypothetical protein